MMQTAVSPNYRHKAIWVLLFTAFLWSSSGLFVKLIEWGPFAILGGRSAIAAIVFWVYLRPSSFRWSKWEIIGALAYVGTQFFFIAGTKLTTAANVIFLQFASPIYLIPLGYWFLRERPKKGDWIVMPIIFIGMFLFFGDDLSLDGVEGNILAVISGICLAFMAIAMRKQKGGNPAHTILLGNLIGTAIGLPFIFQESFTLPSIGFLLYLGIIQIGISLILYSWAIKYLNALEATLITMLEPVLNPVWVFLVLGEVPGPLAFVGATLMLAAIVLRAVMSAREGEEIGRLGD